MVVVKVMLVVGLVYYEMEYFCVYLTTKSDSKYILLLTREVPVGKYFVFSLYTGLVGWILDPCNWF